MNFCEVKGRYESYVSFQRRNARNLDDFKVRKFVMVKAALYQQFDRTSHGLIVEAANIWEL